MKLIVLDTNILLHSDFRLEEVKEKMVIPIAVVEELDGLKKGKGDLAFRARRAIRELRSTDDVEYVFEDYSHELPEDWDRTKNDNKILGTAIHKQCPVLTNDFNLQIKARAVGLEVKEFKVDFKQPVGYKEVVLNLQCQDDSRILEHIYQSPEDNIYDLVANEYLVIYEEVETLEPDQKGRNVIDIFRWDETKQEMVRSITKKVDNMITGKASPRNVGQRMLFELMQNENIPIKLALGKFGTGKDFCQIVNSFDLIKKGKYEKMIWVRNVIEVKDSGEIGFLPGTSEEKLLPWVMPMADKVGGVQGIYQLLRHEEIEIQHLSTIRGRDFKNSIVYCTEIENMTKEHIQLLIGRIGEGSILVMNGDTKQVDKDVFKYSSGIEAMLEKLVGHKNFGFVQLEKVERSETAAMADLLD